MKVDEVVWATGPPDAFAAPAKHACPGGCGLQIVQNMLSCRFCWYRLPGPLRAELSASSPRSHLDPRARSEALVGCLSWFRNNPPVGAS